MMAAHLWLGTALLQRGALVEAETELRQARRGLRRLGQRRRPAALLQRVPRAGPARARRPRRRPRRPRDRARRRRRLRRRASSGCHARSSSRWPRGATRRRRARAGAAIERFGVDPNPACAVAQPARRGARARSAAAPRRCRWSRRSSRRPPLRGARRRSPAPCACSGRCAATTASTRCGRPSTSRPPPPPATSSRARWRRSARCCAGRGGRATPASRCGARSSWPTSCGAGALRDHVARRAPRRRRAARARGRCSGVESLTASERRVAALAADGGTNRDIAQALFVTPKTVEVHLSNAYRKLGVRSRRELGAALLTASRRRAAPVQVLAQVPAGQRALGVEQAARRPVEDDRAAVVARARARGR